MTSFEKLMAEGATIMEHHPNQKDASGRRFRTVKIHLPNSDATKTFPNLRVELLRPFVDPSSLGKPVEGEGSSEGDDEEGKRSRGSSEEAKTLAGGKKKSGERAHDPKTPEPPNKKQKHHTAHTAAVAHRDHERVKAPTAQHAGHSEKEGEGEKTGSHGHGAGRNFEKMMEERTKIVDYHLTQTGNYSVHVRSPDGTIDVFSNISPEHFARYRTEEAVERLPEQAPLRPHHIGDTFEKVMDDGGSISNTTESIGHSVRIIMPPEDGEEERVEFFGNVSEEALAKYKDRIDLKRGVPPKSEMSHIHHKGYSFENCMDKGGIIVSTEAQPFYVVHVKAKDGKLESYSHVSKERLSKYLPEE